MCQTLQAPGEFNVKIFFIQIAKGKDMGGSQRDNDSSPNLSFNDLKQKEIELKEGSACVWWYGTQVLIGQPNGGRPKFQGGSQKIIFSVTRRSSSDVAESVSEWR